jgi:hypothetical protein
MVLVLNGPVWFYGYESIFVFVAGLITILISILSYKAYRLTEDSKHKYFSIAFFLMAIGFFIQSLFSTFLITHVWNGLGAILGYFDFVFLAHLLLLLLAYTILLIITLKIDNIKVITLLFALILLFVVFSYHHFLKFHIVSFMLLFFLTYQFYSNYLKKKNPNARLVFVSFYLLTCAEAFLILFTYVNGWFYLIGRVVQFSGYLVLFYTFLRVIYHDREKRKA